MSAVIFLALTSAPVYFLAYR